MARPVRPEAVARKRKQILDAAHRLVLTKGYADMSVQDILDAVNMSSGAFHHYFTSRAALLEALIERIRQDTLTPLTRVVEDPRLTAIQKLQGYFDTFDRLRSAHRADVVGVLRVWYTDANALVRLKVDEAIREQRAPLLATIVRQGVGEGAFPHADPVMAGEILVSLLHGMEGAHARLLLSLDSVSARSTVPDVVEAVVATHAAHMHAIERVLGAPDRSFTRLDPDSLRPWVAALLEG
jgi:AcrR family transcriptional regulator